MSGQLGHFQGAQTTLSGGEWEGFILGEGVDLQLEMTKKSITQGCCEWFMKIVYYPRISHPRGFQIYGRHQIWAVYNDFQQMYFGLQKNQYINIAKEEGIRSREKISFHDLPEGNLCASDGPGSSQVPTMAERHWVFLERILTPDSAGWPMNTCLRLEWGHWHLGYRCVILDFQEPSTAMTF